VLNKQNNTNTFTQKKGYAMTQNTENDVILTVGSQDVLTEILRKGARKMLADAIEDEVNDYRDPPSPGGG
jgi:predicted DNA-binding protein (MmcQ/YjbR family)